jgi:hypothetical protein
VTRADDGDEDEDLLTKDWTGLCYTAALAWVRDAEEDDWVVVHGTVLSNNEKRRIEHAWCERAGFVVDLARPIGAKFALKQEYYRLCSPEIHKVYPRRGGDYLGD